MTVAPKKAWMQIAAVSSLGIELAIAIGLFSWLGHFADGKWGTTPVLTILGFLFGCAVAVMSLKKTIRRLNDIDVG